MKKFGFQAKRDRDKAAGVKPTDKLSEEEMEAFRAKKAEQMRRSREKKRCKNLLSFYFLSIELNTNFNLYIALSLKCYFHVYKL